MSGVGRGSGSAPSALERQDRWARVAWAFLAEPREPALTALLEELGAVEALARLRSGRLPVR
ncbi:MAG TPA: hypothetical protein VLA55_01960, partial [Ornithinibacter sp.]|nr:hypothetical protein [Ornithinibacter sp.]